MSSPVPWNDARARLDAAFSTTPVAWPNEQFAHPEPPSIWLAVEMTGDVLAPVELGANVWQEEGRLLVHVFAPVGTGTEDARTTAKQVANTFRAIASDPIIYLGASIGHGETSDDQGMWWRLTVSVDWRYQDINV